MSKFSRLRTSKLFITLKKGLINKGNKRLYRNPIFMILVGLIYLILPTDVIIDAIPVLGLVDDAAIIGLILKQIKKHIVN